MIATPQSISVDRIFLALDNPRHVAYGSEAEVIDYLCKSEYVYALAKDMAKIGLNPLELFAVIPLDGNKRKGSSARYVVAEGNRRLCAIKLLNDPDLAPAHLRKDFRALSEAAQPISEVLAVLFKTSDEVDSWLERIHGGIQGGIGRKPWSPDQKTRHLGDRKNVLAQTILDYAEEKGFLSAEERKGKLTTAQRYLGNAFIREAMGIESSTSKDASRNRPEEDVDLLVKKFSRDLVDNVVHSRANADAIKEYSRSLSSTDGISGKRVAATSLVASPSTRRAKHRAKEPIKPKSITFEQEIEKGLKRIGSYKLQKLYYSICDLPLEKHTLLISVGVWSFIETLTARCGRDGSTSFTAFLSKQKLATMGFDKERTKVIVQALERVLAYGNTTKHHDTSANFNGEQLANDMDILTEMLGKLIADIRS